MIVANYFFAPTTVLQNQFSQFKQQVSNADIKSNKVYTPIILHLMQPVL